MPRLKQVFEIDDIETLKLLAHTTALAILEQLGEPRTATELAEALAVPRTRLYHHLNHLVERGLIRVIDTRRVGAIDERIYRVVAKDYRPSDRLLRSAEFEEQVEAVLTTILDATRTEFARSLALGIASLDESKEGRTTSLGRTIVNLSPPAARRFAEEIGDLVKRLEEADENTGEPHAFVFTFYPRPRRL
jgi:DNA-binding transcriptional ArsR family regulator